MKKFQEFLNEDHNDWADKNQKLLKKWDLYNIVSYLNDNDKESKDIIIKNAVYWSYPESKQYFRGSESEFKEFMKLLNDIITEYKLK